MVWYWKSIIGGRIENSQVCRNSTTHSRTTSGSKRKKSKGSKIIFWDKVKTQHGKTYGIAKAVLRGKSIAINSYIRKKERSQINHLTLCPKGLDKEEQTKPKIMTKKGKKIDESRNNWNRDRE